MLQAATRGRPCLQAQHVAQAYSGEDRLARETLEQRHVPHGAGRRRGALRHLWRNDKHDLQALEARALTWAAPAAQAAQVRSL